MCALTDKSRHRKALLAQFGDFAEQRRVNDYAVSNDTGFFRMIPDGIM